MDIVKEPLVTVLMPVFNGEKYLKEAIESILNQTYTNFEFLIINDGSTDFSHDIITSYKDSRIRLINNKQNLKLIATLNMGLSMAKGKYIVRMDCDDISFHNRLEEQVKFMEANPDVGISGSFWKRNVDKKVPRPPLDHETIKVHLLKGSQILHPAAIFRKDLFEKYALVFDFKYIHAEDYDLWVKTSRIFKLANIPKELLMYRTHQKQISKEYSDIQKEASIQILNNQLKFIGISCDIETLQILFNFFNRSLYSNFQIEIIFNYIKIILEANEKVKFYDQKILKNFLWEKKSELWDRCITYNLHTLNLYHKNIFLIKPSLSIILYLKLIKRVVFNR